MKEEVLETVLNEILEDQKQLILVSKSEQQQLARLTEKVASFDQRLTTQIVAPPVDTAPLEQETKAAMNRIALFEAAALEKIDQHAAAASDRLNATLTTGLQKINATLEAQPKPIIRQWRINLFPENDYNGLYRLWLNRLIAGVCILAALTVLGWLGRTWLDNIHSERVNASPAFREQPSPASPPPYSAPNSSPVTHRHHAASPKKINFDSLQTTYPPVSDSSRTP